MGWPRAIFSGLLSLVAPGLGQVHARAWRVGVILLSVYAALGVAVRLCAPFPATSAAVVLAVLATAVLALGLHIFSAVHAVWLSRRTARGAPASWLHSTWFTALAMLSVTVSVGVVLPFKLQWRSFSIPSASNVPTLMVGDYILVDAREGGHFPARGGMIVFHLPRSPSTDYVKRAIGLPGDHVQMTHGLLFLNGKQVERSPAGEIDVPEGARTHHLKRFRETLPDGRSYLIAKVGDDGKFDDTQEFVVPENHVFVLGDSRDNSLDSRMDAVGFVPLDHIVGPTGVIYWAKDVSRIGLVAQ